MIRVMVVDDELPALKMAESILRTFDNVRICGLFDDPDELLERLAAAKADLIFIDMMMPVMHGLELAGRIQERWPDIAVAFVTAYDHYAVDAFETDAMDYVMKPMTADRVAKTLSRFMKMRRMEPPEKAGAKGMIRSFGRFCIETELGKPLKFRRTKTEELLAFLLHSRGEPVSKASIMDALWGDRDAARAQSMLYTTMYQLRKELESFGMNDVIEQTRAGGGACRLLLVPEEWDFSDFERLYRSFKDNRDPEEARKAVQIYKGGYLADNGYEWAAEKRTELELQYIELLEQLAGEEVRRQRYEYGLSYLRKWEHLQPFTRRVHAQIIALHLLMSNEEAAAAHESHMNELFASELGVSPDVDMKALLHNPRSAF
ncbi:response regulator [Paenibacillus chibensis]|uniref:Response regulator n=1 Tax=Paenibacillus chibensis TaxID=59846 RepID=A0ABU6PSW9_9BACL|nr:response regulator [Paenibacillus chibensis]